MAMVYRRRGTAKHGGYCAIFNTTESGVEIFRGKPAGSKFGWGSQNRGGRRENYSRLWLGAASQYLGRDADYGDIWVGLVVFN
ncbi:MAG: hypothetical protein ABIG65_02895 [Patescibacteria group bacterium]